MRNKSIIDIYAQQKKPKGNNDAQIIQNLIVNSERHKDAQNINAVPVLNKGFIKVFNVTMSNKGKPETAVAFIYPQLNHQVLEFMVRAAQNNLIIGLSSFSPNGILAKNYKG